MKLRDFLGDTSGNVALLMALGSLVLFGAAGVAVDYARLTDTKTHLDAAADVASLAALSVIRENPDWSVAKAKEEAAKAATSAWLGNTALQDQAVLGEPVVTITETSGTWSSKVAYSGVLKSSLLNVLGIAEIPVGGEAVAQTGSPKNFWEFTLAIDTSSSMGIGATQADMDAMLANPAINCSFACHTSTTGGDTLAAARAGGHKLRLDVVDDAVDAVIDTINTKPEVKAKARLLGLTNTATELVAKTADLSAVKDHNIEIALTDYSKGNTNFRAALEQLTAVVGAGGEGATADKPKKAVFIVTDGIHDTTVWESNVTLVANSDHHLGPVDPAFCAQMKADHVLVGVLYIDYITPAGFEGWMFPVIDKVLPSLKACASDGMFYNATSPEGINTAMQAMLQTALTSEVRLTQ